MTEKHKQLVLALFDSEKIARQAAEALKQWDKANDEVKAGAVGVIVKDDKGKIKEDLLGPRAGKKGAGIGMVLGLLAAVPTGGLSLLGGVIGGAVGGGIVGSLFHRQLRMSNEDRERLNRELDGGKAAVGVLAGADEAAAFAAKLQELGGIAESHEVATEARDASPVEATPQEAPVLSSVSSSASVAVAGTSGAIASPLPSSSDSRINTMTKQVDKHARTVLPIPDRTYVGLVKYDAKDPESKFPPIEPVRPPAGAPNVIIFLIDDAGFGSASAFGGPCHTPTAERLAAGGLKYNRFHTTALCSPTRAALLTGRNHHTVGMAGVTELATSAPGYNSMRPDTCAPLPETLKLNGYSTAHFGKCHEVPVWETSPMGPFDRWPTGGNGFEYFYGFIGGEANQWYPALYEGTTPVEPPKTPEEGYHLTEDLADHAINYIRQQKALMPDKPFFVYFAPGATHAPHHVAPEWSAKYKGKFDQGWDALREEIFARQKQLGVIPADAELTARPPEIPAWDEMDPKLKPVLTRQMEVYAGFMEHTDYQIGRVVDVVEELGLTGETLIYYIIGDNGASAEGTVSGTFNEYFSLNGAAAMESVDFMASKVEEFGAPTSYNHYAVGWAHALDTPYQWTKQVASHWGGTRNGTIVHWPGGIQARGEVRTQFHHVIDVAPTVLEAAGLPEPLFVKGIQQKPYEGVSMRYSFDDAQAGERHETQYFEMFVNRGIYHKGWTAVTRHSIPWMMGIALPPIEEDVWELYAPTDWTQAHNIAAENPKMLQELQRQFLIEAAKYNVLPLDDRRVERLAPETAGRPTLLKGKSQLLFGGMGRLSENSIINLKNRSHAVTAEVVLPDKPANGVIVAQGGAFGGWSLYTREGALKYCYNLFGVKQFTIAAASPLPSGRHQVRMEFAYAGGGLAKGGVVTLFVDGQPVGEGQLPATQPLIFSADETLDVGNETGSTVSTEYTAETSRFNGVINWVQLDQGADDHDHLISPEERLTIAMARQ